MTLVLEQLLNGLQFGVMLFQNMPQGIREMVRVVKPGGRVLLTAYGDPHQIDFLGFLISAVQSVRPDFNGPPPDPPPLPFQLADPEKLRTKFVEAGLKNVTVETIIESTEFANGREVWDWIIWSNPIVEMVLGGLKLTDDERGMVQQTLDKICRERSGSSSCVKLSNPVNIGVGTK